MIGRWLSVTMLMGVSLVGVGCGSSSDPGAPTGSGGASSASGGANGAGTGGAATASGGSPGTGGQVISSGGAPGTGGRSQGSGGAVATATGGAVGTGGTSPGGTGGRGTGGAAVGTGGQSGGTGGAAGSVGRFSFFVTSLEAMRALSGSQNGFGGDLRFGEATGLAGADKICTEAAKRGMPGAETKTWRAFLSATTGGPNGGPVNAIDRVGAGPWYDRMGRLVSMTKASLAMQRPGGADIAIINDLPNEMGIPNHQNVDNHDTLTGSTSTGMLMSTNAASTCNDWTSAVGTTGKPMLGHSWPAGSGMNWMQAHAAGGCAPGVNLVQSGGPGGAVTVGAGGGYGGIYCFALTP